MSAHEAPERDIKSPPDTGASRQARLTMRTTARQRALIQQAAEATDRSVTDFVLGSATLAAERILADRRWFVLSDQERARFEVILERPVVYKPRLKALFDEPSPFAE